MANSSNTLSQIPVRRIINNPQSQVVRPDRMLTDMRGIFEREALPEVKPTKREAKKNRYEKLESRAIWRAIKSFYWATAVIVTIAEGAHTYTIALTVGVNPLTAGATALALYTGLSLLTYFLFRRLSAYIAFGSLRRES
jgi:hypothetical protein